MSENRDENRKLLKQKKSLIIKQISAAKSKVLKYINDFFCFSNFLFSSRFSDIFDNVSVILSCSFNVSESKDEFLTSFEAESKGKTSAAKSKVLKYLDDIEERLIIEVGSVQEKNEEKINREKHEICQLTSIYLIGQGRVLCDSDPIVSMLTFLISSNSMSISLIADVMS
jgi:hypothetical protein